MDCGTALFAAKPRRVTKPKIFESALHLRLPPGLKERIDVLRGPVRQGDFVRDLLVEGVEQREREAGIVPPPPPKITRRSDV